MHINTMDEPKVQKVNPRCGRCFNYFIQDEFKSSGLPYKCCKSCREKKIVSDLIYRENNKEKIQERDKKYREGNKEKIAERTKTYRKENIEIIQERHKKYYENNKEKIAGKKSQKIVCECGSVFCLDFKIRHEKTKKHVKWLKENNLTI